MGKYATTEAIREAAGRAASAVLPDEVGDTLPVVTRTPEGVRALVLYYRVVGPPKERKSSLPTHAMWLDPVTATVVRFWECAPDELGLVSPLAPVPGAGADMSDMDAYLDRWDRFLELSPEVWEAFADNRTDASAKQGAKEYWELFLSVVTAELAPVYVGAARDFFDWVRATGGIATP